MAKFIPLIKTVDQILKDRDAIKDNKRKHPDDNKLIPIVGVNVSFSHFGLQTVRSTKFHRGGGHYTHLCLCSSALKTRISQTRHSSRVN